MAGRRYPLLSIRDIPIDPAVARRLPRGLAEYYAALPVGEDRGRLTVAMALPEDSKPVALLESLLRTPIVPVQTATHEVRAAIRHVWRNECDAGSRILCCDGIPPLARLFAASLGAELVSAGDADPLVAALRGGFLLTVTAPGDPARMARWVRAAPGALLFAGEVDRPIRRIVVVLRGHSPDEQALRFVLPLARVCGAAITLIGIGDDAGVGLAGWLLPGERTREQFFACADLLYQAGLAGSLKLREGEPAAQIAQELAGSNCDLLVMAAEAHGDAVSALLSALQATPPPPVLILKPGLDGEKE
jgi:nucleotide-binding universal stress UspA family protein